MDINPLSIFFGILRIAVFIFAIIFFAVIYAAFTSQVKTDDLERYSVELADNIMNSELASSKYVFDAAKMDSMNGKEIPSIRSCSYTYKVIIEDFAAKKTWEFGKEPLFGYADYVYGFVSKKFDASVAVPGENTGNFYETINPGRLTLTVYDYFAGRIACTIEKAFTLKEPQNLTIKKCPEVGCFTFARRGDNACLFHGVVTGRDTTSADAECKTLPQEIVFEDIYETYDSLRQQGIDPGKKMNLVAYPLRTGATCGDVKTNPGAYMAGKNDDVITVLLCIENVK